MTAWVGGRDATSAARKGEGQNRGRFGDMPATNCSPEYAELRGSRTKKCPGRTPGILWELLTGTDVLTRRFRLESGLQRRLALVTAATNGAHQAGHPGRHEHRCSGFGRGRH